MTTEYLVQRADGWYLTLCDGGMKTAPPLTCGNGSPWPCGPCSQCQREADRLEAEFQAAVTRGKMDVRGDKVKPARRTA